MSWQATKYAAVVLADAPATITTADRAVLLLLAGVADARTGESYAGSPWIAERAGLTDSSVRRSLGRLLAAGLIAHADAPVLDAAGRHRRTGRPTRYRFPLSTGVALARHPDTDQVYPHGAKVYPQRDTGVPAARHETNRNGQGNMRGSHDHTDCAACDGTGWIEVSDTTRRAGTGLARCDAVA